LQARDRRRALTLAVLCFLAVVATGTGVSLYQQLSELRAAPQDNVQWSLAQLETDLLDLQVAIQHAEAVEGDGSIATVRRRFDVFYSRVQTVRRGTVFEDLRRIEQVERHLQELQTFLERTAPIVDAGEATLTGELEALHARVHELLPVVRDVSLAGVRLYAAQADTRRHNFVDALVTASSVAFGLILLLAVSLAVLDRQHRVSLRRAAEVSQSRDRLSATIGASLDAVVVTDAAGRIVDWNGAAERIFGYSRDRAVGADMAKLIVPEGEREQHRRTVQRYLDNGGPRGIDTARIETYGLNADGRPFPVEMALGVTQGADGPIFIYYLRDISTRLAQQEALVAARDEALAAERAKTDFLAVMSHEMRTPLNGVLGVLDLLERTKLDPEQRRYVATAAGSGEILLKHINDVLDVTRVEAGKMAFQREPIDLKTILDETLLIGGPMAEYNGNTAVVTGDGPAGRVLGDPHRLRQVLLNLFSNAAKFTRNGRIELALAVRAQNAETAEVEISVSDTGPGVPSADRQRIFDDFVTLDSGYDRNVGGSGLGLAICRRIVQAMGGEIGVEPGRGGRGSRFWIRLSLPCVDDAPNLPDRVPDGRTPASFGAHCQVLLVEDNEVNRMVAEEMLRQAGHEVASAADGMAGIAAAAQRRYDLILMDISMPGMDGVEAAQAIRSGSGLSKSSPIVALTAHALPEDRRRFAEAGMQDVIVKPLRRTELLAAAARYVMRPEAPAPTPRPSMPADHAIPDDEDEFDSLDDIFDPNVLSDLAVTLTPEALSRTINLVRQEIGSSLAAAQAAARARDDCELARQVHRMAGCAAMVGASALHTACGEVERACKAGDGDTARARCADLPDLVDASQSILSEFVEDSAA
jgi:PAS domain S-box-containing protein